MNDTVLVDSSFLYSLFNRQAQNHAIAYEFVMGQPASQFKPLVPDVALPEVTFLMTRMGGTVAAIRFLDMFHSAKMSLECLTMPDLYRARDVMAHHYSAHLDLGDCCIVALAERLDITRVCTFDRRDFSMIRPAHADYLELLP